MTDLKEELRKQFVDWQRLTNVQIFRILRAPGIQLDPILVAKGGSDKIATDLRIATWRLSSGSNKSKAADRSQTVEKIASAWSHCADLITLIDRPDVSDTVDRKFSDLLTGKEALSGIDSSRYAEMRGIGNVSTFSSSLLTDLEIALDVLSKSLNYRDVAQPAKNYNIDDYIEDLMYIYREFFGRNPSVSDSTAEDGTRRYTGPFLRFSSAALKAIGNELPDSTIHSKWKAIKKNQRKA